MSERVDTIVIGGGQAGLHAVYHLGRFDREHIVLERGLVGETWRTERWDSFRLNTPNHFLRLPGHEYTGDDRESFLTRDETVAHLERYAAAPTGTSRPAWTFCRCGLRTAAASCSRRPPVGTRLRTSWSRPARFAGRLRDRPKPTRRRSCSSSTRVSTAIRSNFR